MSALLDEVCEMLDMYEDRITNLQYMTTRERLISRLIFLAKKFGIRNNGEIVISVPITHKDIAGSINTSRETVNKEFKSLAKRGLIKYIRNEIIVNNIESLESELSSFDMK